MGYESVYPWIPREYYKPTIEACKYIRETGWFNKAVEWAVEKYDVDEDELIKHIRARQAAGQRYASKKKGKQMYKYYSFIGIQIYESGDPYNYRNIEGTEFLSELVDKISVRTVRALNAENARRRAENHQTDPGDGSFSFFQICGEKEFPTKKELESSHWDKEEITATVKKAFPYYKEDLTPKQIEANKQNLKEFFEELHRICRAEGRKEKE